MDDADQGVRHQAAQQGLQAGLGLRHLCTRGAGAAGVGSHGFKLRDEPANPLLDHPRFERRQVRPRTFDVARVTANAESGATRRAAYVET